MKKLTGPELSAAAATVKLLLMDCDGVLTDGRLYFSEKGEELKVFHVRDGQGLSSWHKAGFRSGIISGRDAGPIIMRRAEELGIEFVKVRSEDKLNDLADILSAAGVTAAETAFVGDDIGDLSIMKAVGLAIAVADAVEEAKENASYVTTAAGGLGAIREVTDLLLSARS